MNEASRWRLAMAGEVVPVYTRDPRVRAVLVGGSVARGYADAYSDVEIGVFWDEFPAAAELRQACERSRGTDWELDPYTADLDVWYEEYAVRGLKIDLRHMTVGRMSEVLAGVVEGDDVSEARQEIIATAQHGIALHGAAFIERWRARAAAYPERLARAMVQQHLSFKPWWFVTMLAERGDLHLVYGAFKEATRRIFGTLLGLNRAYYPGFKWLDRTLATLPVAPTNLAARIHQAFRAEPAEGAEAMRHLIEETFSLVEQQMPDLDLAEARQTFRYRRPATD